MLLVPVTTSAWERLARRPFQWLYGSGGQLGARNLERAQLRTMLTAAALLIGVSMIVVIQGMTASFSADLLIGWKPTLAEILFVNAAVPLKREMQTRFESLPGVYAASPIRYFETTWIRPDGEEETLNFMAIDPSAHTSVTGFVFADSDTNVSAGGFELDLGSSVFISSVIAEKFALGPATRSGCKPARGQSPLVAAVVMDFYNQGMVVTGSWADMRRFFRINDANTILIKVRPAFRSSRRAMKSTACTASAINWQSSRTSR
jgi:putative ABC transport system permease protein